MSRTKDKKMKNPLVFMDISIGEGPAERIVFEVIFHQELFEPLSICNVFTMPKK